MSEKENKKETQKRSEFIGNFNSKKGEKKPKKNINKNNRWNMLYNQSKTKRAKEEKYREQILKERNKKEFKECTFSPQKFSKIKLKEDEKDDEKIEYKNLDKNLYSFMNRQKKWLDKRQNELEGIKEKKNNKDVEECLFRPIMSEKVIDKEVLSDKAAEIIEDPESYNQYIKRLEEIRNKKNEIKNEEKKLPGSGYLWNNKPKKYNYNYDYTKHENADKIINRPKSVKNNYYHNYIKKRNKNENFEQVFKEMYTSQSKRNDFENNIDENHLIKIDNVIDFGKALDIFHRELYSFDLMD